MKFVLTLCGVVLGGMLSMSVARAEVAPGAPTILAPMSQTHTSSVKPVIAGVTQTGTQVDVYIDQQFNGRASVLSASGATTGWSYTPFLNLSQGWHTVTVKAQNAAGARSEVSAPLYVYIDLLVPAPTLLTPVVNADTTNLQPWIVGLSKGGMTLEVWIDGVLNGQVEVGGTRSQTESFKYRPFLPLSIGTHLVRVVATDNFGGVAKSASVQFSVQAIQPTALSTTSITTSVSPTPVTPESTSDSSLPTDTETETETPPPAGEQPVAQPAPIESVTSPDTNADTNAAVNASTTVVDTTDTNSSNPVTETPPETSKRENVLTTIGWVLLALVAIGMIARGRAKPPADDQLVKIDTTDSTPHVEVIRKPEDNTPTTPAP